MAFADDLTVVSDSLQHLEVQCDKLSRYSSWAKMEIKLSKCAATGAVTNDPQFKTSTNIEHFKTAFYQAANICMRAGMD